jgi:hypothetical protein
MDELADEPKLTDQLAEAVLLICCADSDSLVELCS